MVAKGYGVRRLGESAPVDAQTLFGIASNTKVFTATALGLLVEEGKIEWDAPVSPLSAGFQMWDPCVTRELTVRDLLVHRSGLGLGAGDCCGGRHSTYDRKEIARRLRFIPSGDELPQRATRTTTCCISSPARSSKPSAVSRHGKFVRARIIQKVGMTGEHVAAFDAGQRTRPRRMRRSTARCGR